MVKLDWSDPKKELARRELRNSIITFFDKKARRNLDIVHLPGATDLEYLNVYKPLGINPSGIVGVEREPEAFRILEEKKSRGEIEYDLYYGTIEELMTTTKKRFDIISADTTELFGIPQLEMIHNIFQREVIKDRGILYTEFAAKRDKKSQKQIYDEVIDSEFDIDYHFLVEELTPSIKAKQMAPFMVKPKFDIAKEEAKATESLSQKRSRSITECIRKIAASGRVASDKILEHVLVSSNFLDVIDEVMSDIPDGYSQQFRKRVPMICAGRVFCDMIYEKVKNDGGDKSMANYFLCNGFQSWFSDFIKRYEYTNQTGFLMYVDIFGLDKKRHLFAEYPFDAEYLLHHNVVTNYAMINNLYKVDREYQKSAFIPLTPRKVLE